MTDITSCLADAKISDSGTTSNVLCSSDISKGSFSAILTPSRNSIPNGSNASSSHKKQLANSAKRNKRVLDLSSEVL